MVKKNDKVVLIIDTKWKNIDQSLPSTHDLRQMYVYNEYWQSTKSLLLYPSNDIHLKDFKSFEKIEEKEHHQCGLGKISIFNQENKLDEHIGMSIISQSLSD
ncbi:McrBC 5-methylcytosine restriction system component [compost metagenome]